VILDESELIVNPDKLISGSSSGSSSSSIGISSVDSTKI
jgi:hypothetical protein